MGRDVATCCHDCLMAWQEWSLPLTSAHPAGAGGLRLLVEVEDAVINRVEVRPGAMHRGAEKLFESRDYRSLLALSDRHAWASSFTSEVGLAQLVENMMGIPVPLRAQWLRTVLAEATRMTHHLLWLSATAEELGLPSADKGHAARTALVGVLERYTGMRVHHMIVAPGGLRWDCPPHWPESLASVVSACVAASSDLAASLDSALPSGLGRLLHEDARTYATSGPVARASGVPRDERIQEATGPYAQLRSAGLLQPVTEHGGDARARFKVLAAEVKVSARCVLHGVEELARTVGDVGVPLPKSLRVPEGHGYHATAAPAGTNGWFLVSRGGPTPYRLHLRSASFNNAAALSAALPGTPMAWLPQTVMSMFLIAGDTDK